MTKPDKNDANTKNRREAADTRKFITLHAHAKGISVLVTAALTFYLALKSQYFDALCAAGLTLAAATSDRLKRIKIGRQGFLSEWLHQEKPPGR